MNKVYGTIYRQVGKVKKAAHVYVGEGADKAEALKIGVDFLRERAKAGLAAEIKVLDEDGSLLHHVKVAEPAPLVVDASELDMVERGLLT